MLLTISTEHEPATDLGYLLHKHPDRLQTFDLSFGKAHVYYPEAGQNRCAACLLLDVDPVGMVRGKNRNQSFQLGHYVNDRPYVASSFMSVAISQVFGTAMGGRCKDRPELVSTPMPLVALIDVLPVRGGEGRRAGSNEGHAARDGKASTSDQGPQTNSPRLLHKLFEPLGYTESGIQRHVGDASRWSVPSCRPSVRVDSSGVSGLGASGQSAARLLGSFSTSRTRRWKGRITDTDGSFRTWLIEFTTNPT